MSGMDVGGLCKKWDPAIHEIAKVWHVMGQDMPRLCCQYLSLGPVKSSGFYFLKLCHTEHSMGSAGLPQLCRHTRPGTKFLHVTRPHGGWCDAHCWGRATGNKRCPPPPPLTPQLSLWLPQDLHVHYRSEEHAGQPTARYSGHWCLQNQLSSCPSPVSP